MSPISPVNLNDSVFSPDSPVHSPTYGLPMKKLYQTALECREKTKEKSLALRSLSQNSAVDSDKSLDTSTNSISGRKLPATPSKAHFDSKNVFKFPENVPQSKKTTLSKAFEKSTKKKNDSLPTSSGSGHYNPPFFAASIKSPSKGSLNRTLSSSGVSSASSSILSTSSHTAALKSNPMKSSPFVGETSKTACDLARAKTSRSTEATSSRLVRAHSAIVTSKERKGVLPQPPVESRYWRGSRLMCCICSDAFSCV